jgi:hypothetical protein
MLRSKKLIINIQIDQDELKRPEIHEAVIQLLNLLNGTQAPAPLTTEVKTTRGRRKEELIGRPDIDPEIQAQYGERISKAKSLYFLSVIKRHGSVNSDQIAEAMQMHYPSMTRKSIGGITGAVSRWFQNSQMRLPYVSKNDKTRNGIHIFTWVGDDELSEEERGALIARVPSKFQNAMTTLLDEGSIGKNELKSHFQAFSKIILELGTDYFESEGNRIVYRHG